MTRTTLFLFNETENIGAIVITQKFFPSIHVSRVSLIGFIIEHCVGA